MKFQLKAVFALFFSFSVYASQGELLGMNPLPTLSAGQMNAFRQQFCPSTTNKYPTKPVQVYMVTYETVDVEKNPAIASGLIAVPHSDTGSYGVVSYQHGTVLRKNDVPSRLNGEGLAAVACFTAPGFMVVAADYLGYGENKGFHPYLNPESEGTVAADMIDAAEQARHLINIQWNGKLFLTGYSQGGHATAALHRHMEATGSPYKITASAPLDGAYDLEMSLLHSLNAPSSLSAVLMGYSLWTRFNTLAIFKSMDEAVRKPWADKMGEIYNGNLDLVQAQAALPATPAELLQPDFMNGILNDPNHIYRRVARGSSVFDWKPVAPMYFIHASGDDVAPYNNAEKAVNHMLGLGVTNVQLIDIGQYTHKQAVPFAFMAAAALFETL